MRGNKYIDYIESGLGIPPNGRQFRKIALGPCLFVLLCGLIPCVVLRGNWLILLFVMLATSFSITTTVFVISFKPLSLVSRLVMQSLIYSNFVMQLLLLEAMFYIITWGIDYGLIPLLLIPLLIPFIIGAANARKLSKNQTISGKGQYIRWYSFAWTGVGGMLIAKTFLSQMSQKSAMAFVILAFTILSCIFAVGLLSYQRLYFLKKYVN